MKEKMIITNCKVKFYDIIMNQGSEIVNIQEELLKRYKYLYENKELILANCIVYGIEKEHIKKQLKKLKSNVKRINRPADNSNLIELVKSTISNYKADLKISKPYLSSKISENNVDMMEELILGDIDLEKTRLYMFIESVKENNELLSKYNSIINALEERRSKNQHLKNIPTFTVWKILSYVRKKYSDNATVLAALDKYYNLDRFTIANDDCNYGYYIPDNEDNISYNYPNLSLYASACDAAIVFNYRGNEFEEEDEYHAYALDDKMTEEFYPTQFAYDLANSEMMQNKKEIIKIRTLTII